MQEPRSDAYSLLESAFHASPNLRSHKQLPRRRDEQRSFSPAAEPLKQPAEYSDHDETDSQASSQDRTPRASPGAVNEANTGLPPTPPSTSSQDGNEQSDFSPPPHADGVVASLTSRKSSLSTPVNQRSPPTPDPSPPRTTESTKTAERPNFYAYPSSRADSFTTAREDQYSSDGDSRSITPLAARLSTVEEDRGLGLAFERDDNDTTPTDKMQHAHPEPAPVGTPSGDGRDSPGVDDIPNREWDTNLMRNVTIRKKRNPKPSPHKNPDSGESKGAPAATGSPAASPRRNSRLRERVEASRTSPHTPSMEDFAQSIGWPTESKDIAEKPRDSDSNRHSTSSATSAVVEAMVIVTPPRQQRRQTLRHSGRNLAYRRDTDSPSDFGSGSVTRSNRNSLHSDDVPLHRLMHKRASVSDRKTRLSAESDTLGNDHNNISQSSIGRRHDPTAYTLAHQESIRNVLQPAADIMSRSNSVTRSYTPSLSSHKRVSSAPEAVKRRERTSPGPRTFLELSPPISPAPASNDEIRSPRRRPESPATTQDKTHVLSSSSPRKSSNGSVERPRSPTLDVNKSLPELPSDGDELPIQHTAEVGSEEEAPAEVNGLTEEKRPPSALLERVRHLLAEREAAESANAEPRASSSSPAPSRQRASSLDTVQTAVRTSRASPGRSQERRRGSRSQDRTSTSGDTEEIPRQSHESPLQPEDHRRVSFDRSTVRTEEHAMARHVYAQTTPFSQFSDTPVEVSEATAVSIYPHNNNSLLVVQSRPNTLAAASIPEQRQVTANETHFLAPNQEPEAPPTPPFVDASEGHNEPLEPPQPPTLTVEPSTPPMQISLPNSNAVDSPLKNPRPPPEPPVIKFIPPTPAEELERQLPPGPPRHSDSHPQRRLSIVQRARRYSDNFISPILARASSSRARYVSDSHAGRRGQSTIPNVSDGDGALHPFWRPRGFWDDFEESDSEDDDAVLPSGGDTSDVEGPDPEDLQNARERRKRGLLGRRLTNGLKGSRGFLIGNSLGLERHGTNRRSHHVKLPRKWERRPIDDYDDDEGDEDDAGHEDQRDHQDDEDASPKVLIHPPTNASRSNTSSRVEKRSSRSSLRSSGSYDRRRMSRREQWRNGRRIPGLKGVQFQYLGFRGMRDHLRERSAIKRRDDLKKRIGSRYYVENGP